jgi:hypothetical protein
MLKESTTHFRFETVVKDIFLRPCKRDLFICPCACHLDFGCSARFSGAGLLTWAWTRLCQNYASAARMTSTNDHFENMLKDAKRIVEEGVDDDVPDEIAYLRVYESSRRAVQHAYQYGSLG